MVIIRVLLGIFAFLACALAQPVKPPDKVVCPKLMHISEATSEPLLPVDSIGLPEEPVEEHGPILLHKRGAGSSSLKYIPRPVGKLGTDAAPLDPPRSIDETRDMLGIHEADPEAGPIVEFHRHYDRLFIPDVFPGPLSKDMSQQYETFRRLYPRKVYNVRSLPAAEVHQIMNRPAMHESIRTMKGFVERFIDRAHAVNLDRVRLDYLDALKKRFEIAEARLYPDLPIPLGTELRDLRYRNRMEQYRERSTLRHHNHLVQDYELMSRLEDEMDHLAQVTLHAGPELARRSLTSAVDSKTSDRSAIPANASRSSERQAPRVSKPQRQHLHSRTLDPPDRKGSQSLWHHRTTDQVMKGLGIRKEDLGAYPVADFLRLNQPIFPPIPRDQSVLQSLAAAYEPYQLEHPFRGSSVDITNGAILEHELMSSDGRDRLWNIDAVLKHIIESKDLLGLDPVRVEYLHALRDRFDLASRLLTPTIEEHTKRGTDRLSAIASSERYLEDMALGVTRTMDNLRVRTKIVENNARRLTLDLTLLGGLEDELDRLVTGASTRMVTGGAHIRRSLDSIDLQRRQTGDDHIDPESSRLAREQRRIDRELRRIGLTRHEPGAMPILRVWRLDEDLLQPNQIDAYQKQELAKAYRRYQDVVPVRGSFDLEDSDLVATNILEKEGRDRLRFMQPVISHMLRRRNALHLNPARVSYLQALRDRFAETERYMTPTIDEHAQAAEANARALGRTYAMGRMSDGRLEDRSDYIISQGKRRATERHRVAMQNMLRWLKDLDLANHLEIELDRAVQGVQGVGTAGRRLRRRRTGQEELDPDLLRLIQQQRNINREYTAMHLSRHEPGSRQIRAFYRLNSKLLGSIDESMDQLSRFATQYRRYQDAIPHRGTSVDLSDGQVMYRNMMFARGRNRFRAMQPIIAHLLENKRDFLLDNVRVQYLQALQHRFRETEQLMTPTPDDFVKEHTESAEQTYRAGQITREQLVQVRREFAVASLEHIRARKQLALANLKRWRKDLEIVNDLEKEFEDIMRYLPPEIAGLHRRALDEPGTESAFASQTASRTPLSANDILASNLLPRNDPSAKSITTFLRRQVPVLPSAPREAEHRQALINLYGRYKARIPIRGTDFPFENDLLVAKHMTHNVGRDRFIYMDRVLSYLVSNSRQLGLDKDRLRFLQSLTVRFAHTAQLMSPTVDEYQQRIARMFRDEREGRISSAGLRLALTKVSNDIEARTRKGAEMASRFTYDLALINKLEQEFDAIVSQVLSIGARAARRKRRRDVSHDAKPDGEAMKLEKREPSPPRASGEESNTQVSMSQVLTPTGMSLADPYAQAIANWRLSDKDLLEREHVPSDLKAVLRGMWHEHRNTYGPQPITGDLAPEYARLSPYLNANEGERFDRINHIIRFLLQHRTRLRLSPEAIDYLDGLQQRFDKTYHLMQPSPAAVRDSVVAKFQHESPQAQERRIQHLLNVRNGIIMKKARDVKIDSFLLQSFESEMDDFHGLLRAYHL